MDATNKTVRRRIVTLGAVFGEPFNSATIVMPLIRSGDGFRDQDLLGTTILSLICRHARTLPCSSHQSEAQLTP